MASNQTNHSQSLDSSVEEFIDRHENENTKKKTKHHVALFHKFLVLKGKIRQLDKLTPQEWNKFLSEFLLMFHKKEDNEEYEPNSLMEFFTSFEHHLKKKNYGLCLTKDIHLFEQTRKGLQSKLGKFHGRSAFKHSVVQQHNPFRVTRLQGAQRDVLGRCKTLSNFHRAGVI